jgi:hypothetical protein
LYQLTSNESLLQIVLFYSAAPSTAAEPSSSAPTAADAYHEQKDDIQERLLAVINCQSQWFKTGCMRKQFLSFASTLLKVHENWSVYESRNILMTSMTVNALRYSRRYNNVATTSSGAMGHRSNNGHLRSAVSAIGIIGLTFGIAAIFAYGFLQFSNFRQGQNWPDLSTHPDRSS